jgi:adenine deaminase
VLLTALALGVFLFTRVRVDAEASAPSYDLLITNARIVDGSGNPWFKADVAIKDGRIARIGRLGPETAPVLENDQMTSARPGIALRGPGSQQECL